MKRIKRFSKILELKEKKKEIEEMKGKKRRIDYKFVGYIPQTKDKTSDKGE